MNNEEKCISAYYNTILPLLPILTVEKGTHDAILHVLITFAPIFALLCLAIYAAASVLIGLIQFEDCPGALTELEQEIIEAKAELKKRGISCD